MTINLYSTAELIQVQQRLEDLPDGFWRRWFGRTVNSDSETILFEHPDRDRRILAPFVSPLVQGRVMKDQGHSSKSFKPAYLKPKHVVDPSKAIARMPGEAIGGSLSIAQRFDAKVAENMRKEREMIERRIDWMCAMAIINGTVTVSGEDYPTQVVDFERHADLTVTKTLTARWGESAEDPLGDIKTMRRLAFSLGYAPVTDLIFGLDAWDNFSSNTDVKALLSTQTRGSETSFSLVAGDGRNFEYMGRLRGANGMGQLDLWTYNNWYTDENGSTQQFLGDNQVVGVGGALDGVQFYGAILDADSMQAVPMFPKMWKSEDPSAVYTMTQSAPLPVPFNANNTFLLNTR